MVFYDFEKSEIIIVSRPVGLSKESDWSAGKNRRLGQFEHPFPGGNGRGAHQPISARHGCAFEESFLDSVRDDVNSFGIRSIKTPDKIGFELCVCHNPIDHAIRFPIEGHPQAAWNEPFNQPHQAALKKQALFRP